MFWRMLYKSFRFGIKEKLLIVLTVAFGAALASMMLNVSLNIGDKMNQELKSFGANIQVIPKSNTIPLNIDGVNLNSLGQQTYLQEKDLLNLKRIFWANNILNYAPYLETTATVESSDKSIPLIGTYFNKAIKQTEGETFTTGVAQMKPWWKLTGRWPRESVDSNEVIVGKVVADTFRLKPGDQIRVKMDTPKGTAFRTLQITGVVDAGGKDDEAIFAPLITVQKSLGLPGKVSRVEVSALTVPDTALAKKAGDNPLALLSETEYEEWYCTAFVGSIAYQIDESIPGSQAEPMRKISASEGQILTKIQTMVYLISFLAIMSAVLGIASLMNSKVAERKKEIALMKAIGATDEAVAVQFIGEALLSGVLGGFIGYGIGVILAQILGQSVFGTEMEIKWLTLPLILLLSGIMMLLGSYPAIRKIIRLEPVIALQGR